MGSNACQRNDWPDALAWADEFLGRFFGDAFCGFHVELMGDLQDWHKRLIARVAPRGHGKSALACLAFPLWCICERKRRNILIITQEHSLAKQFVRDIRTELECNEGILSVYGNLCEEGKDEECSPGGAEGAEREQRRSRKSRTKWTEEKFETMTGITVQARGVGASLRGTRAGANRPDLIICDDIEKDELVATSEGRKKLEHWLRRVVMPALAPDGRLIVVGSILHHDSLLSNLRDVHRFPRWDYKVYRAIETHQTEPTTEVVSSAAFERIPLWAARWPLERLDEERHRIGSLAFEQEYQANPADDETRVFQPEWLQRYDAAELESLDQQKRMINLMCVDPATGVDAGDYFALWVGGVDRVTGIIYTRELTLERIGIVQQVNRITAAFERWRPAKIGIETNAYQVSLKQILDEFGTKRRLYLPVVAIQHSGPKKARIEASSVFFENGTFRLPRTLPASVEDQFLQFPRGRHDDAPDVCAMAIELARETRSAGKFELIYNRNGSNWNDW